MIRRELRGDAGYLLAPLHHVRYVSPHLRYHALMSSVASPTTAPRQGRFQRFWRALRQMFLEAIGALFAFFGVIWLSAALRSYGRDVARWLILAAIAFALLFFFFAFSSFRRARKL